MTYLYSYCPSYEDRGMGDERRKILRFADLKGTAASGIYLNPALQNSK